MSVWQEKLPHSETWLIGVSGRLDQSLNPKLEETLNDLLESGHFRLVVDLTHATYINSGGRRRARAVWCCAASTAVCRRSSPWSASTRYSPSATTATPRELRPDTSPTPEARRADTARLLPVVAPPLALRPRL